MVRDKTAKSLEYTESEMERLCEACRRKFQDCAVRECPKKPGHWICLYCCMRCKRSYRLFGAHACRAFVRAKEENAVVAKNATSDVGEVSDGVEG